MCEQANAILERLGIYENRAQLDHDVSMLMAALLSDLAGRGVGGREAMAAVRRWARKPW